MKKRFVSVALTLALLISATAEAKKKPKNEPTASLSNVVSLAMDGDFKNAAKLLGKLESKLRHLSEAERNFVVGYADYKMGKYDDARKYMESAAGNLSMIEDHRLYVLADSCLMLEDFSCASKNFNALVTDFPSSVWKNESDWGLVAAAYGAGNYQDALAKISKLEPDVSKGLMPSEYYLMKARILDRIGRKDEAAEIAQNVYFSGESKKASEEAKTILSEIKSERAREISSYIKSDAAKLRYATQMIQNYNYDEGLRILEGLHAAKGDLNLKETLAESYFRARDYKDAKKLYKELVENDGLTGTEYILKYAQSASRTNDFDTAIGLYQRLLGNNPGGARSKYLYKLGFLYLDANRYEQALEKFQELAKAGYGGYREKIMWNVAWCNYKLGRYDDSIQGFEKYKNGRFGRDAASRADYWIARAHEKAGNKGAAKSIYSQIITGDDFGYYGFLSLKRVGRSDQIPEYWMAYSSERGPAEKDNPVITEYLAKAKYLSDLGLKDLAFLELKKFDVKKLNGEGQGESVALMKFAMENGDYRSAHLAALWKFKPYLDQFPKGDDFRHFVWEGWYPEAHGESVKRYAKDLGIDPRLAYSIMREESRFQTDVVSKADAIGLMQIIPSTAMRLADELNHHPFALKQMFVPQVNVKFGVRYLGDLSKMFDGEKAYVIASYNAGEDAVQRWIKDSDAGDIEEFIEEIPYSETNQYVKRVLKTYWIYSGLY